MARIRGGRVLPEDAKIGRVKNAALARIWLSIFCWLADLCEYHHSLAQSETIGDLVYHFGDEYETNQVT
jgi:hypothetical protein